MIKLLEEAIAGLERLPPGEQELRGRVSIGLCESGAHHYQLSDAQIAEVELAKREVREGKIASDAEMDDVWRRFGRLTLRFSARARSQLLAIHEYISERSPSAAARVGASIRQAAEILQYFPYSGRSGRTPDTREWVVRRYPYVLVYEVGSADESVTILGVFHCAKKRD